MSSILREFVVKYLYGYDTDWEKSERNTYGKRIIATKIWSAIIRIARYRFLVGKGEERADYGVFDCDCARIRRVGRLYFVFERLLK